VDVGQIVFEHVVLVCLVLGSKGYRVAGPVFPRMALHVGESARQNTLEVYGRKLEAQRGYKGHMRLFNLGGLEDAETGSYGDLFGVGGTVFDEAENYEGISAPLESGWFESVWETKRRICLCQDEDDWLGALGWFESFRPRSRWRSDEEPSVEPLAVAPPSPEPLAVAPTSPDPWADETPSPEPWARPPSTETPSPEPRSVETPSPEKGKRDVVRGDSQERPRKRARRASLRTWMALKSPSGMRYPLKKTGRKRKRKGKGEGEAKAKGKAKGKGEAKGKAKGDKK